MKIYDYGVTGDKRPYLLMEYLEGLPMDEFVKERWLGLGEKCHILTQIARALQVIHQNGIIHRDIKPANIHIDEHLHTTLMDFGIARLHQSPTSSSSSNYLWGTPAYLAPETLEKDVQPTPVSDLFSFGVIAYELLIGKRPFAGESIAEVTRNIQTIDPPWPCELHSGFPVELDRIIRCLLQKDPARRAVDLEEVIQTLRKLTRRLTHR
ncbi:MAG: serine/threonine protein kinase [Lentisphaerae bacterium]|nr:MAG: serine/threonine protein kinase [Lentisphaerota bacterium]